MLRMPGFLNEFGKRKWKPCYAKGWDYNPFYTPGAHHPHVRSRYYKYARPPEPEDPFFSL